MTQPPYTPPGGHPMRRFAIFATALFVLVVIGSQGRTVSAHERGHSICVCMASKAQLILRSLSNTTNARAQAPSQPHLTETALAAE